MKRKLLVVLVFGLWLAVISCGCGDDRDAKQDQVPRNMAETNAEQAKAVAEIQKLGGKITIDEKKPDKPVTTVYFSNTKITDAGLENLKGLTQLQTLVLEMTKVTDAGLEHLKGLTQLQSLNLWGTKVTDAGLENLKGLSQLEYLYLSGTKVTDKGINSLRQALPKCKIEQ